MSHTGQASASVSQTKQDANSNYLSVNQQSGIQAGSGGFAIQVQGNTDLKGGVIASDADASKNTLSTQTLTTSDLQNQMNASASSSGTTISSDMVTSAYGAVKGIIGNAMNQGSANDSDSGTTQSAIAQGQITVGGNTTDTSKDAITDTNGTVVSTDTKNANGSVRQSDVQALQTQAAKQQADNNLLFTTTTAFSDEAYRKMYQMGGQLYRVPPGCSDKSCIIEIVPGTPEYQALLASQDGKVHFSNNGIMNDLDAAAKYGQQHGGLMPNATDTKNYSDKPESQYIIYAPDANNLISELMVAGYAKTGISAYVGLTTYEQTNANLIQQNVQQGKPMVIDSHSRGTLTTTNAQQWLINNGGLDLPEGQPVPSIQMNNYGAAQNNDTANTTLQTLTGNSDAKVNSIVHTQDQVGTTFVTGNNPTTPTYTNTAADRTVQTVTATNDGKGPLENFWNILTGKATPHSCYGTAREEGCGDYWKNIPKSNAVPIGNNAPKSPPEKPEEKK